MALDNIPVLLLVLARVPDLSARMLAAMNGSRTLFYTPAVGISARVLNRDIHRLLACATACIRPHNERAKLECSFNASMAPILSMLKQLPRWQEFPASSTLTRGVHNYN